MSTYLHNFFVQLDRDAASLLFNYPDITVSSLCWMERTAPARLNLGRLQHLALKAIGAALEHFWPGHCAAARNADRARAQQMLDELADILGA